MACTNVRTQARWPVGVENVHERVGPGPASFFFLLTLLNILWYCQNTDTLQVVVCPFISSTSELPFSPSKAYGVYLYGWVGLPVYETLHYNRLYIRQY